MKGYIRKKRVYNHNSAQDGPLYCHILAIFTLIDAIAFGFYFLLTRGVLIVPHNRKDNSRLRGATLQVSRCWFPAGHRSRRRNPCRGARLRQPGTHRPLHHYGDHPPRFRPRALPLNVDWRSPPWGQISINSMFRFSRKL